MSKYFPDDSSHLVTQLHRFIKRDLVVSLKRGLYCFADREVDTFTVANQLYSPSYISLETALNYHGVIPDVPLAGVSSVSPTTTRKFITPKGTYFYQKLAPKLFWGYSEAPFKIAFPEKALLDYIYYYGLRTADSLRIDWRNINVNKYKEFDKQYRRTTLKWMMNARKKYFEENHWVRMN